VGAQAVRFKDDVFSDKQYEGMMYETNDFFQKKRRKNNEKIVG